MFSVSAIIKHNGLVTQITSSTGPDRTGLVLELIGDNAPTGAVSSWPDTSGSGNHAVQATGGAQPLKVTSVLGSHAIVRFDGVDDFLTTPDLSISQPNTIYVVGKTSGAGNGAYFDAPPPRQFLFSHPLDGVSVAYAGGSVLTSSTNHSGVFNVFAVVFNGASSVVYVNGVVDVSGDAGANGLGVITLSKDAGGGFTPMDTAHYGIFTGVHSTEVRQAWETYLGALYGIAITH